MAATTAGEAGHIIARTIIGKGGDHSNRHHNIDKHEKKHKDKIPSDHDNKAFKPCLMHGPKRNHTFEECYKNPKKQDKHQVQDKNHQYEAHHNDAQYTSDDDELHASVDTPVPSEDHTSASSEGKINEDENYHLHLDKN